LVLLVLDFSFFSFFFWKKLDLNWTVCLLIYPNFHLLPRAWNIQKFANFSVLCFRNVTIMEHFSAVKRESEVWLGLGASLVGFLLAFSRCVGVSLYTDFAVSITVLLHWCPSVIAVSHILRSVTFLLNLINLRLGEYGRQTLFWQTLFRQMLLRLKFMSTDASLCFTFTFTRGWQFYVLSSTILCLMLKLWFLPTVTVKIRVRDRVRVSIFQRFMWQ